MTLLRLLRENYYDLIEEADDYMHRAHLRNYSKSPEKKNSLRIKVFLDLLTGCIKTKNMVSLVQYAERTAVECFETGFDLCEVQRALNGLEKAIWKKIVNCIPTEEHAATLGLLRTILGVAKDTLAFRYIYCTRQQAPDKTILSFPFLQNNINLQTI